MLEDLDRYEDAIVALEQIRELDPHFKCIDGRLLHAQRRCLDWRHIRGLTDHVISQTLKGQLTDAPLNMLAISDQAPIQLACAQQAMADQPSAQRQTWAPRTLGPHDKIRIAYVSGDLREHAVSYLMAGVFNSTTATSSRSPPSRSNPRKTAPWGIAYRPRSTASSTSAIGQTPRSSTTCANTATTSPST